MRQAWQGSISNEGRGQESAGLVEYGLLVSGILGFIAAAICLCGLTLS